MPILGKPGKSRPGVVITPAYFPRYITQNLDEACTLFGQVTGGRDLYIILRLVTSGFQTYYVKDVAMKESHFKYSTGRYDCSQCGEGVLITQVTDTLPVCPRCGSQHYEGQPPKIIAPKPSLPKKYAAGMYECKGCGDKLLMTEPDESLPECAYCGANKLVAVTKSQPA